MKLRDFILTLLVAGITFSCTNEEALEGPDGSKAIDGCVSTTAELTLNMGKIATKADPGYKAATEEELSISKGYVVVFALETKGDTPEVKEMMGEPTYFETTTSNQVPTDKNELEIAYTIPGIRVTTGKLCRILVIANTELDLSEVKTYSELFDKVESYGDDASAFAADKLVKVGYTDVTFSLENRKVEVPMTQLAAKVSIMIQMGRNWTADEGSDYSWKFEPTSGFTVNYINTRTDLMLVDDFTNRKLTEKSLSAPTIAEDEKWGSEFSFYTYEKTNQDGINDLEVRIKGKIHQYKDGDENPFYSQEEKEYSLTLNAKTVSNWDGIRHGNLYDVIAKISPSTMKTEYELTVKSWGTPKQINVEPYYLYVRDLKLLMPSITTHSTTYNSSPDLDPDEGVKVIKVVELTPDINTGLISERELLPADEEKVKALIDVSFDSATKEIKIDSPLPDNYVGRRFTIEVKNKQGLTQEVVVDQYPPFYFDSKKTAHKFTNPIMNQTNHCMYIINTLVTDFTAGLPDISEISELMEYHEWVGCGKDPDKHNDTYHTSPGEFTQLASERLFYLRETAVSGYPLVKNDGSYETINTEENNRRISPRFMLASQAAITSNMNYSFGKAQEVCRNYTETEEGGDKYTDWRVPTLAELYLIDVVQNVKTSSVKEILEGSYYWSAYGVWGNYEVNLYTHDRMDAIGQAIRFMDNRSRSEGSNTKTELNAPVRCVRDLK